MNKLNVEKELSINATLKTTWVEFSLFDEFNDTIPESKDKEKIISLYEFMLNNNTLSTTIADTATSNS